MHIKDLSYSKNIMAANTTTKKVLVPKEEYLRLKRLDKRFKDFFSYLEYLNSIEKARKEKHSKKGVEQEKLFKQLGIAVLHENFLHPKRSS